MDIELQAPTLGSAATAFPVGTRRAILARSALLAGRRMALFDAELDLRRFLPLEDRVEASADEVPKDEEAKRDAESLLDDGDPWTVASAAWAWLETGRIDFDDACRRLARVPENRLGPWREALRRLRPGLLAWIFPDDRAPRQEALRALVLDARAWSGMPLEAGSTALAAAEQPWARAAYARALGFAPRLERDAARSLLALIDDPEPPVFRRAYWSAALHDPVHAVERVRGEIRDGRTDPFLLRMVGLLGGPGDADLLLPQVATASIRRAAIRALGDLGDARMAEPLLRFLDSTDGEVRSAALEAFEALAGRVPRHLGSLPCASTARSHWESVIARAGASERLLRGRPVQPDRLPAMGSSMEAHWRAAVRRPAAAPRWLRREVPSAFFGGDPAESLPGE